MSTDTASPLLYWRLKKMYRRREQRYLSYDLKVKAAHAFAGCLSSEKNSILEDVKAVVQMYMRQCISTKWTQQDAVPFPRFHFMAHIC